MAKKGTHRVYSRISNNTKGGTREISSGGNQLEGLRQKGQRFSKRKRKKNRRLNRISFGDELGRSKEETSASQNRREKVRRSGSGFKESFD